MQSVPKIGARLAAIRAHRGMSQAELGDAVGVSKASIWNYEHNLVEIDQKRLAELARALACHVDDLTARLDAPMPKVRFQSARDGAAISAARQIELMHPTATAD